MTIFFNYLCLNKFENLEDFFRCIEKIEYYVNLLYSRQRESAISSFLFNIQAKSPLWQNKYYSESVKF